MQITAVAGNIVDAKTDAIIVNLFEGVTLSAGGTGVVDAALGGIIGQELKANSEIFKGKSGETLVLPTYGKITARTVIIVGLGKSETLDNNQLRKASAAAVRVCTRLKIKSASTLLHGAGVGNIEASAAARLLTEGTLLAAYQFKLRKGKPKVAADVNEENDFTRFEIVEADASKLSAIQDGITLGSVIAEQTNNARDWVNDSANFVTPTFLKDKALAIKGLSVDVLDRKQIEQKGMGALAAVARGSVEPPYLLHLKYTPDKASIPNGGTPKVIALVGKGITFDSGGLSLKPPASMETMKMDMAGAAVVLSVMDAIASLKDLPYEVHGFVATCENMPSGNAVRPGDIVTAMNGKTIEINNTDAEGRLILADALTFAQEACNPDEIIDLATLTGACIVALGKAAAGAMGTDEALIESIRQAGTAAGEKFWPLPLFDEYKSFLKSDAADLINSGAKGEAGSSAGGMFLKEFIDEDRAWVHLDIAGPAWMSAEKDEVPKGASGFAVRSLLYYLYNIK